MGMAGGGKARYASPMTDEQDKGHAAEMRHFAEAVKSGKPFAISNEEALRATLATFVLQASIAGGGTLINTAEYEAQWISATEN